MTFISKAKQNKVINRGASVYIKNPSQTSKVETVQGKARHILPIRIHNHKLCDCTGLFPSFSHHFVIKENGESHQARVKGESENGVITASLFAE